MTITPERDSAPFWRSASGKLLIQNCTSCGENFHYPRTICPFCAGSALAWVECSGRGRIYTYSVTRRGEPYAIAFVTLDEGPRLMTNIVDCDFDRLAIDDPVEVVFHDIDGTATPMFRPAARG